MPPRVSINLCCYNSEKYLEETLQSIFSQTYPDWELVIVNDGSTDSTEAIAKRHLVDGKKIIFHSQPNAGLGNARNKAVELSSGEFIALIDHDDLWMPKKLEMQMRLFEENPRLGLVYSDGYTIDSQGKIIFRYSTKHLLARGDIFDKLIQGCFIPPSGAVIKRHAFDEIGPFLDFRTVEECDLFLKIAYRYPVDYVEEPLFKYRSHNENFSLTASRDCLHRETIAMLAYWLNQFGRGEKKRFHQMRKLAALAYASYGMWLVEEGRMEEARENLLRSLKFCPFQWRYLHLLLTWLPASLGSHLLNKIRTLKVACLHTLHKRTLI